MTYDEVVKFKCPEQSYYQNSRLLKSIDLLLDLPDVVQRKQGGVWDSAYGEVLTSVGNEYSDITTLPGAENLVKWVKQKILEWHPAQDVQFLKTWCNKMYKGSQGLVHAHVHPEFPNRTDFVAIFYVHIPENGAQLILIDGGTFNSLYTDYPLESLKYIPSESGDLLIHSPEIPHAVSVHNSETPRVCLIFEGRFIG